MIQRPRKLAARSSQLVENPSARALEKEGMVAIQAVPIQQGVDLCFENRHRCHWRGKRRPSPMQRRRTFEQKPWERTGNASALFGTRGGGSCAPESRALLLKKRQTVEYIGQSISRGKGEAYFILFTWAAIMGQLKMWALPSLTLTDLHRGQYRAATRSDQSADQPKGHELKARRRRLAPPALAPPRLQCHRSESTRRQLKLSQREHNNFAIGSISPAPPQPSSGVSQVFLVSGSPPSM
jgi:hypothetical protein